MTIHMMPQPAGSPAMDHNGFVSRSPLYHQHVLNDCHDGRRGGAQTLGGPAGHLELSHLVLLARLQKIEKQWHILTGYSHVVAICHKIFTEFEAILFPCLVVWHALYSLLPRLLGSKKSLESTVHTCMQSSTF